MYRHDRSKTATATPRDPLVEVLESGRISTNPRYQAGWCSEAAGLRLRPIYDPIYDPTYDPTYEQFGTAGQDYGRWGRHSVTG